MGSLIAACILLMINLVVGKINIASEHNRTTLFNEMMRDIVKSCATKFEVIAIYGNYDKEVFHSLSKRNNKNILLINKEYLSNNYTAYQKIDLMIMVVDHFYRGLWPAQTVFNHFIEINSIFIFNKENISYCIFDVFEDLQIFYESFQVFICYEHTTNNEKKIEISMYNPFTNYVPAPMWTYVETLGFDDNRTNWTIYRGYYPTINNTSNNRIESRFFSKANDASCRREFSIPETSLMLTALEAELDEDTVNFAGNIFSALVAADNVTNKPNFSDNKGTYNCKTRECFIDNISYEYDLVKNMKESVDPCENFYEYACGNFDDFPHAPKLTNRVFESITSVNRALDALTLYSNSSHKLKPLNFLRDLIDSCKNLNQNNDYSKSGAKEDRLEFLEEVISKLGGWPVVEGDKWNETDFDWIKFVSQAENIGYVSGQSFMHFIVLPSVSDGAVSFNLYPPQLEFTYEHVKNVQNSGLMSYYYNYMINVAKFLGANVTQAKEDLRAAFEFEKQLFYGTNHITSYPPVNPTFPTMALGEIKQTWPSINWDEYFNNHLLPYFPHDNKTLVAIWNTNYITNFEKLMNETSKRVQANYAIWKTIQFSIPFIKSVTLYNFAQTYGFFKQQLIGFHDCFAEAKIYLPSIIRAHYARNYPVSQQVKQSVGLIFSIIKQTLLDTLKSKNLDAHTKDKVIKKIESLTAVVGYPEELFDDEKLDEYFEDLKITKDNYLGNFLSIQSFTVKRKLTAFGKPTDLYDWKDIFTIMTMGTAQESYYCRRENILVITDWLSKFLINTYRYNYTNFGAIGALIGYEIGRAVDFSVDFGEKYLNNETEKCIVEKHSNYTVGYGTQAYGIVNLKNAIAQQMGVELAYSAYRKWAEEHGEEPNLARMYTPNQLFWLAYGNINCSPKSWTYTSSQTSYDKRVNWPLSNIPEFSKDFNCPLESSMNPKNKCIIL